jgi:hypothetical protein
LYDILFARNDGAAVLHGWENGRKPPHFKALRAER